jgi:hypothetical protein
MELHIITVCLIIIAIEPAYAIYIRSTSWYDRHKNHREWKNKQKLTEIR